jgi:hypothetical protein
MHYTSKGARWILCLAIEVGALGAGLAHAAALSLDVGGMVAASNDPSHTVYHLTEAQLLALPIHSITTSTTWTARSTFTGPSLADILKLVGAHGSQIEVHTLDDYTETIPVSTAIATA